MACKYVINRPPTSSSGPCNSIIYEMPSSGINTSNALVAVLYWRVSAVFADLSLIMSTLTIHFWIWLWYWIISYQNELLSFTHMIRTRKNTLTNIQAIAVPWNIQSTIDSSIHWHSCLTYLLVYAVDREGGRERARMREIEISCLSTTSINFTDHRKWFERSKLLPFKQCGILAGLFIWDAHRYPDSTTRVV